MKYFLCFLLFGATVAFADDTNVPSGATILVRLTKVTGSPNEAPTVVATFEPIRIDPPRGGAGGFGGGHGPGGFGGVANQRSLTNSETVIGKPFTVDFYPGSESDPMSRTLCNVIHSCRAEPKADPRALKLHLIISIPEKSPKELSSGERDFSQWVIESVDRT